jgi:hypothetical protein
MSSEFHGRQVKGLEVESGVKEARGDCNSNLSNNAHPCPGRGFLGPTVGGQDPI